MGFYKDLGVTRVINCFGTYTLVGGHVFSDKVRSAMDEADRNFAWLWELEEKAGKRITELTGAEAGFVTPGVFAALSMGAAACMAGKDSDKMSRLSDTTEMKNEFIIQRALRDFKYDRSMTVAGGKLVEVGDKHKGCTAEELEAAITEKTAGFHYMAHGFTGDFASRDCNVVPFEKVVEIAHRHGLPVIVDAAFQCYPKDGFKRYISKGADLVAYSCKYFGGPNTAGILLGKKDLVDTVALHSFVGQEGGPGGQLLLEAEPDRLHGSVFRGYKMDRSSITGAVASLEEHLEQNYEAIFRDARVKAARFTEEWGSLPGVKTKLYDIGTVPEEPGRISLHLILDRNPDEVDKIVKTLMKGDPSIWASSEGNHLVINITSFRGLMLTEDKDTDTIIERVREAITG
ncbi:MAG: PLP-dependent transferase [Candidatus Bathyarchaeota archaeon]|nr:PLP-dependent transferase [Candidatus Bathyarchaeota archaeon]